MTPPLSPNSAQTPSPVSPLSSSPISLGHGAPTNGQHPRLPSPHDAIFRKSLVPVSDDKTPPPFAPSGVRIASRSPSPISNPFERRLSGETISQSPMTGTTLPLSLLDVLKPGLDPGSESDDDSVYTTHTDPKRDENGPLSPSVDSDAGLAYTHDSDNDTPVVMPLDIRKSAMNGNTNKVKFPTSSSPHPSGPSRQISASSLRSALSSRSSATSFPGTVRARSASAATQSTARSGGALERAYGNIARGRRVWSNKGSGKPSRSNTVPGPASPEQRPPKLPTRSHTSPSHPHIHTERVGLTGEVVRIRNRGSTKRKDRICARCNSKIEDGRWIQMDGGNVLCERCWKNMYLPKCRRCNLPIEKQAVSSRDGQLKGKYHKDCFNCDQCQVWLSRSRFQFLTIIGSFQKPFPDKEFYVFDGKPFCAYHYHEANNSLCGAFSCGQPIEGPCAVTHSGKRYHPEHLLCEFEDGCRERLEEYWEVDGQMLCEHHAAVIGNCDSDCAPDHDPVGSPQRNKEPGADEGRMMKRMTRFIDLGVGGDNELDIR
ncbi:hypothetical protein JVU11DRAFT_644 [Chiua virens]|nr:hypothetical protein JVU11DRAFT_644 [Chiua virens]